MRIVQIIDSLEIGGAEKMAVNFANALNEKMDFSAIVVTRKEGKLFEDINNKSNYLFLNKKRTIDFKAVFTLKSYCKSNQIEIVQAHGTSFFTAFLLKLVYPKIAILFHDHSGARSNQNKKSNLFLWLASYFFIGIIVVNHTLKDWAIKNLNCKKVIYLPNFTSFSSTIAKETILHGNEGFRILCLANLRNPKNHQMLIDVAIKIKENYPNWSFHLIGKDSNDEYSNAIKHSIRVNNLESCVFIYGQKNDIEAIINQSEICIITSFSEGLPVALLEYGLMKKPVVSTNVGEIPLIIKDGINGFIVDANDASLFYQKVVRFITESDLRAQMGDSLYQTVIQNNSEEGVIANYLNWILSL